MSATVEMDLAAAVLGDSLVAASETMSTEEAEHLAEREYGLRADARALSGERDSNFNLRADDGREYMLKVAHSAEDPDIFEMQTLALLHVAERDPALPVQRVVRTQGGSAQATVAGHGRERKARLVTYVAGTLQRKTPPSLTQRRGVGVLAGRLQNALADFAHPAARHHIVWDIKNAGRLRPLIDAVADKEGRGALAAALDRFDARVAPRLASLRTQVVHNDLNGDNVLVDPADPAAVTGVIDFGDMVETAVAIDVAVGAAYQLSEAGTPFDDALAFLSGFASARRLEPTEADLLHDLIVARMALRILITEARAARFPENRAYILRNTPVSWAQLDRLLSADPDRARVRIRNACANGEA